MDIEYLEPIKISVVAPRNCCKTTLIVLFYNYLYKVLIQSGNCKMICKNHRDFLLGLLNGLKNLPLNPQRFEMIKIVPPTMACDPKDYEFLVEVQTEAIRLVQPIQFFDTTGEYLECWTGGFGKYNKTDGFNNFLEHLHKSHILWIPIDATILMVDKTKQFIVNCLDAVIKEWKSYNPQDGYLQFVIVKCDSYILNGLVNSLIDKFKLCYNKVLKNVQWDIYPLKLGFGDYLSDTDEWTQCTPAKLEGFNYLLMSVVHCMQINTKNYIASQKSFFFKNRINMLDEKLKLFYSDIYHITKQFQFELQ